ncbi:MAG TPA: hypothetical protein VF669_19535 [Tepidisphaeraceae bacterium]|jgi:hypothetical protein
MELLNSITGKVTAGVMTLAVIAAGISWWQMDPATRHWLVVGAGKIVAWIGTVIFLPWVTFFITKWVAGKDSNSAGALLVAAYTIPEMVLVAWLFDWKVPSATAWTFFGVGALVAGAYNLLVCDWIAERLT